MSNDLSEHPPGGQTSEYPVYALEGVGKRFGYRAAVEEVTLEVAEGEFMLLLGNNGAGKTTLLRLLSTLMLPSSGRIAFRGLSFPKGASVARGDLGMISHDSRCYPDLTAVENLKVFGTLYSVVNLSAQIDGALAEVGLEDVRDLPARAYSSGMLKRLAIARLLLYNPRVLLLDEPYSGLDQASIVILDNFLRRFRDGGGTTIMVTHQFTGGVGLATRVVILHRGRLVYNFPESQVTPDRCAELLQQHGRG